MPTRCSPRSRKSRSPRKTGRRAPAGRTRAAIAAEDRAHHESARRFVCNLNLFWTYCPQKACRRVRACAGDPDECFNRRWLVLSPDEQQYRRDFLQGALRTNSVEQAMAFADARRAERRRLQQESFSKAGARA